MIDKGVIEDDRPQNGGARSSSRERVLRPIPEEQIARRTRKTKQLLPFLLEVDGNLPLRAADFQCEGLCVEACSGRRYRSGSESYTCGKCSR